MPSTRFVSAVVFHEGSTLLVVTNALRLLTYRDPPFPKQVKVVDTDQCGLTSTDVI